MKFSLHILPLVFFVCACSKKNVFESASVQAPSRTPAAASVPAPEPSPVQVQLPSPSPVPVPAPIPIPAPVPTPAPAPTASSLPRATHPIDLGYYYADGRYGNYSSEVFSFTNLAILGPDMYFSEATWGNSDPAYRIETLFQNSLKEAFNAGKYIYLYPGAESVWDKTLDVAAPYWSRIKYVEFFHEDSQVTASTAQSTVQRFLNKLQSRGLRKPLTVALESPQAETVSNIDVVAIEAYIPPPFNLDDATNTQKMNTQIISRKNSVPSGKQIIMVMMAYDRNGQWTNMETLKSMQYPAYLHAYNDSRVVGITMFSYARPGGSRDHSELRQIHQQISRAITDGIGGNFPP